MQPSMRGRETFISVVESGTMTTVRTSTICNLYIFWLTLRVHIGDIVRFTPSALTFNTHTGMETIYGVRANVVKSEGYSSLSASRRTPNTLTTTDKTIHGFKRRVLAQVFSTEGIKAIQERLLGNIRDFVDLLGKEGDEFGKVTSGSNSHQEDGWTNTKHLAPMCDWVTFDVIGDLCYGRDFDMLHLPDMRWFPSVVLKITQRSMTVCNLEVPLSTCY